MQFIQQDPRDAFYAYYKRNKSTVTWEVMKSFLLNQMQDPVNRALEAAQRYQSAAQKHDQSVQRFVTYLELIEDELEPYSEVHRVQHLFAKLLPQIQTAITDFHKLAATRIALVELASTLERNLQKKGVLKTHRSGEDKERNKGDRRPTH